MDRPVDRDKQARARLRSVALAGIERKARHITREAHEIRNYLRLIVSHPPYDTRAEDAMEEAHDAILNSAKDIRNALDRFKQLKRENRNDD